VTENDISYKIRGAIFKVYNALGPGLLESVYVAALMFEFRKEKLNVRKEVPVPVYYENEKLEIGFRIDLLIENKVVIELKTVELLTDVHTAQILTYMKLGNYRLGLLLNFNVKLLKEGIKRFIL